LGELSVCCGPSLPHGGGGGECSFFFPKSSDEKFELYLNYFPIREEREMRKREKEEEFVLIQPKRTTWKGGYSDR
jgi:hypothetical protein